MSRTDGITAADVQGRREAEALARTDHRRALVVARAVRHPWYRCQSLTAVADAAQSPESRNALLAEALQAAFEQDEPNRVVCAAGWPLRAMVEARHPDAARVVRQLLAVIAGEPHGLRRLDGLAAVFVRVMDVPALRAKAWRPFLDAAESSTGWRTERLVSWVAVALAAHDRAGAVQLLAKRRANRFTHRARAEIASLESSRGV
jgi:hypothetical protein